jgi:hypothetical protein
MVNIKKKSKKRIRNFKRFMQIFNIKYQHYNKFIKGYLVIILEYKLIFYIKDKAKEFKQNHKYVLFKLLLSLE